MTASKRKGGKTKISHRQSPRFLLVTSHNPPPNPQDNGLVMSCLVKDQKYLSYLLPFILLNASVRLIQSIFNNAFTQPILQTFFYQSWFFRKLLAKISLISSVFEKRSLQKHIWRSWLIFQPKFHQNSWRIPMLSTKFWQEKLKNTR